MDNMRIILEQADHEGLKELLFAMVKCGLNIVVSDDSMEVIPHLRESTKYDFAGATIEKLYVESTVNEYNYGHENQGSISNVDEIPAELMTEEAQPLWKKLRDAGFIVADGYALADGVSNNQAAYIADRMSEKLKIKNKWKVFQQLWNIENMAQLAGSWRQTGKLPPKTDEIDEIME